MSIHAQGAQQVSVWIAEQIARARNQAIARDLGGSEISTAGDDRRNAGAGHIAKVPVSLYAIRREVAKKLFSL